MHQSLKGNFIQNRPTHAHLEKWRHKFSRPNEQFACLFCWNVSPYILLDVCVDKCKAVVSNKLTSLRRPLHHRWPSFPLLLKLAYELKFYVSLWFDFIHISHWNKPSRKFHTNLFFAFFFSKTSENMAKIKNLIFNFKFKF